MLGYVFENQGEAQVARMFGRDFAETLATLTPGSWQGPVNSGYGLHLVYINDRTESWLPPLDEIRDSVLYELMAVRRQQANEAFYRSLHDRYEVIIEQPSPQQGVNNTATLQ
jgi:parvulin-like peptidyl-prolyl isomerase